MPPPIFSIDRQFQLVRICRKPDVKLVFESTLFLRCLCRTSSQCDKHAKFSIATNKGNRSNHTLEKYCSKLFLCRLWSKRLFFYFFYFFPLFIYFLSFQILNGPLSILEFSFVLIVAEYIEIWVRSFFLFSISSHSLFLFSRIHRSTYLESQKLHT
jgi:hypothetical protein